MNAYQILAEDFNKVASLMRHGKFSDCVELLDQPDWALPIDYQNESGNTMKSLLGSSHLQWDTKHTQGAYAGRPAYDAHTDYMAQTSIQGKYHCANEMTNPFPIPHKKEWADLGPYRAQVNAATRAQEAAMAKKKTTTVTTVLH